VSRAGAICTAAGRRSSQLADDLRQGCADDWTDRRRVLGAIGRLSAPISNNVHSGDASSSPAACAKPGSPHLRVGRLVGGVV